ncbi:unnamed protein product [Phaedon cochleariae]|uniref:Membrane-bound transcription factor site-2 protease n=1 Tax=Phaedon cochleariae TaxID=80249 RepID=A0A9P0DMY6_PHACE|nr:unnamed protein product [Phaedon cochleariae]
MDGVEVLIVIGVIYGLLLFFDNFFKTCAHYPYIKFLEGTGLQVNFLGLKWKTKAFNRAIIRLGNTRPRFWNTWFTLGIYTSLILLPISIILFLYSVLQNLMSKDQNENNPVLVPIIPGINVPTSELGYYSLSLIVCSIVHELGHAIAAVLEDVNLVDVGANIFFILPIAYVNISTEKLVSLENKKTLKILCAGIWHNLILAAAAFFVYCSLPFLLSMFFYTNNGIMISDITKNSPLLGSKGLNIGDVITNVNDCEVVDEYSWQSCLSQIHKQKLAICIDENSIHSLDESIPLKYLENNLLECCDDSKSENICFEYMDEANGVLEIPGHACLPGRKVVEQSKVSCTLSPNSCPINQFCFRPVLGNATHLHKINCENRKVIYLGLPQDIYSTVKVSSYIPKYFFSTPAFADVLTKFTKYVIIFSLGLSILNVIPILYMDGQYIAEVLGMILLKERFGKSMSKAIITIIIYFFTMLLLYQCCYTIFNVIF